MPSKINVSFAPEITAKPSPEVKLELRQRDAERLRGQLQQAYLLYEKKNYDQALNILTGLVSQHPTYFAANYLAGASFLKLKNWPKAAEYFLRAFTVNMKDADNLKGLIIAFREMRHHDAWLWFCRLATDNNPDDYGSWMSLADSLHQSSRYEDAIEAYRKAERLRPDAPDVACGLARTMSALEDHEGARGILETAIRNHPDEKKLYNLLARLPGTSSEIDVASELERLSAKQPRESDMFAEDSAGAGFHAGFAYEKKGEFRKAWSALVKTNRKYYEGVRERDMMAKAREARTLSRYRELELNKPHLPPPAPDQPALLYILGCPRSGKTTLEQLIALHPDVRRGFETHMMDRAIRAALQEAGYIDRLPPEMLPRGAEAIFGRRYSEELAGLAGGRKLVTDTNPGGIAVLPVMVRTVPNVRVIYVKRNRDDLAFRMFQKHFRHGHYYTYDLRRTYERIDWYQEALGIFAKCLPEMCCTIEYESMVENPANSLQRALDFCGLPRVVSDIAPVADDRGCAAPYRAMMEKLLRTG